MPASLWLLDLHWETIWISQRKTTLRTLEKYTISGEWETNCHASEAQCRKILLLPASLHWRHVPHHRSSQGFVLHGQSHFALRRACVTHRLLVLSSPWIRWEGVTCHYNSSWFDCVSCWCSPKNVPRTSEVIPLIVKYSFTVLCEVFPLIAHYVFLWWESTTRTPVAPCLYGNRYLTYKIMAPVLRMQSFSSVRQDKQLRKQYKERKKNSHHNSNGFVGKLLGSYSKESGCCKLELGTKSGDETRWSEFCNFSKLWHT